MGTTFNGVYVVAIAENIVRVGIVVFESHFHFHSLLFPTDVNGFVEGNAVLIQIANEFRQSAFVVVLFLTTIPLVFQNNTQSFVQESQLPQPIGKRVEVVLHPLENFFIGQKGGFRSRFIYLAHFLHGSHRDSPLVALGVSESIPIHFHLAPFRKGIHHGSTHTVQPARNFVGGFVKLSTGVEYGHNDFQSRFFQLLVLIYRNTATVVLHGNTLVLMNGDLDAGAIPRHGFVDAVIHNFVHQMVQAMAGGIANVHGRPTPYCFQPF